MYWVEEIYAQNTGMLLKTEIPMLIAHRGIHFYYKYKTKNEAFSYEPEKHWNKQRIWRLIYGITPEELYNYLPEECNWNTSYIQKTPIKEYALIREDCYVKMRANVKTTI